MYCCIRICEACIEHKQLGKGTEEKIKYLSKTKKIQVETEALEFIKKFRNYFKERYNSIKKNYLKEVFYFLSINASKLHRENLKD